MPTFEQLLTARLGPMETAVTQWTEMIGKLKTPLQDDAKAMKSKADKSAWKGENATVTKEFVTKTAKEFDDAVKEAESVRDLLKDAHGLFKSAQDDLKHAYENPPPGIIIHPNGVLSHRVHPDRRSKDSTEPVATEAQFEALRSKLEEHSEARRRSRRAVLLGPARADTQPPQRLRQHRVQRPGRRQAGACRGEAAGGERARGRQALRALGAPRRRGAREAPRLRREGQELPGLRRAADDEPQLPGPGPARAVLLLASSLDSGGRDGQLSSADARLYKALSGSLATATGPDSSIGTPGGFISAWTDKLITTARDGSGLPMRHPGRSEAAPRP